MTKKFKIGDKVRVKGKEGEDNFSSGFRVASEGPIVDYWDGPYPYVVQHKNSAKRGYFAAKELELINRKGNK